MSRRDPDLTFYFVEAPMRFAPPAQPLEVSTESDGSTPDGPSDEVVAAAAKYRRIGEVVDRLDHEHQRVLRAFYVPLTPGARRLFGDLGDMAGVVLATTVTTMAEHADLVTLLVASRSKREKAEKVRTLVDAATAMVSEAHRAFREARKAYDRYLDAVRAERRRARIEALVRGAAA